MTDRTAEPTLATAEEPCAPSRPAHRSPLQAAWRKRAITAGLEAFAALSAARLAPGAAAGRGILFTLHHVRPAESHAFDPNGHLSVTPQFLAAAIREVQRAGYDTIPLHEVPERLADPRPGRRFASFTLDDGNRDNAVYAAPVFREHGVPYTIFIAKGLTERTATMWWETAAELVRDNDEFAFDFGQGPEQVASASLSEKFNAFDRLAEFVESRDELEAVRRIDSAALQKGIDARAIVEREIMDAGELRALAEDPLAHFGAHTVTHRNLARLPQDELDGEIAGSVEAVEQWTGTRPRCFAHPYGIPGSCGDREAKAVAAAGLEIAVTTRPDVLTAASLCERGLMPRVSLNGYYQQPRYVRALMSGLPFGLTR